MNFNIIRLLRGALLLALLLITACSGDGGSAAPAGWTGTKQLGVAGAYSNSTGVAVDASGNVYVAGQTGGGLDGNTLTGKEDFFLTRYDKAGIKLSTKQLGVAGTYTAALATAVDTKNGYVYVVGYTTGGLDGNKLAGRSDCFLTKYDTSGSRLSTKQLGVAVAHTIARDVAVDMNGNVYVVGNTSGGLDGNALTGRTDFFLTKYSSTGIKQYTRQLGAVEARAYATSVAVDAWGFVYVVGYTTGGLDGNKLAGRSDFFLTKYDSAGTKLSTRQLGEAGAQTLGNGVAVDANGNVYVAGSTNGGLDGNAHTGIYDFFLTKYNSAGIKQYTKQLGVAGAMTAGSSVAVDASGNVYVAGSTNGGLDRNAHTGIYDFFLTKYNSAGIKQYTRQLGVAGAQTSGSSVALDAGGNVYVAGLTRGGLDGNTHTGTDDFFVTKYDSTGKKQ